ncbi:MAG: glycosyl hydrolase family 2 [bacterium]
MIKRSGLILLFFVAACLAPPAAVGGEDASHFSESSHADSRLKLDGAWSVRSSEDMEAAGRAVSQAGFSDTAWKSAEGPGTVMAMLVEAGVYPDPFTGENLRDVPGTWPPPLDVSALPMPPGSPFRDPWWFRTEFNVSAETKNKRTWLHLRGVNYAADVWINGKKIAGKDRVYGTYRTFCLDVTGKVKPGRNALALKVYPPGHRDLAITWVDWNPAPPDRNMGLWKPVYITTTGPVDLRFPHVVTELDTKTLNKASLTPLITAVNASGKKLTATIAAKLGDDITLKKQVALEAGEEKEIEFKPAEFPELVLEAPELWWPADWGEQNLYDFEFRASVDETLSDRESVRFGIREVSSEFTDQGHLVFKVNGRRIMVRGAGWAPDMFFRNRPERLAHQIKYVKEMGLNTIRLEGKMEREEFFELCDREGILVMAGWCCCHHWERWRKWDDEDYKVAKLSQRDQVRRLRHHPSMLAWLNGSDNPPPKEVEKTYLEVLEDLHWPAPAVSSATEAPAEYSGPSGVKMNGPYEWVPPVYWYEDKKHGGAWGFNTETSPGPAVPPVESLENFLPGHLWPVDKCWEYHCGRNMFGDLDVFTKALEKRYGKADTIEDYAVKSQAMTYEGQRAMIEAFRSRKYTSTGVIQWMLNDAWPSLIWHLYDYYLRPAGGYFGTKKACEPMHVMFDYQRRQITAVNGLYQDFEDLVVSARVLDISGKVAWSKQETIDLASDGVVKAFSLPELRDVSKTYFLSLRLTAKDGKLISRNFYWLSKKRDELAWALTQWYYTPAKNYADFTALDDLPAAEVDVKTSHEQKREEGLTRVTIRNTSGSVAFQVRLKLTRGRGGDEDLPVFWEDNYSSLLPGEAREITASYYLSDLEGKSPALEVSGWNVPAAVY